MDPFTKATILNGIICGALFGVGMLLLHLAMGPGRRGRSPRAHRKNTTGRRTK